MFRRIYATLLHNGGFGNVWAHPAPRYFKLWNSRIMQWDIEPYKRSAVYRCRSHQAQRSWTLLNHGDEVSHVTESGLHKLHRVYWSKRFVTKCVSRKQSKSNKSLWLLLWYMLAPKVRRESNITWPSLLMWWNERYLINQWQSLVVMEDSRADSLWYYHTGIALSHDGRIYLGSGIDTV